MLDFFPLQLLLATFAGWVNRDQRELNLREHGREEASGANTQPRVDRAEERQISMKTHSPRRGAI